MTAINTSTRCLGDFFVLKKSDDSLPLGYASLREDMREEWKEYCKQRFDEATKADMEAAAREPNKPVELSVDQMKYLTGRYNPRRMSEDEYNAFVQDMVDMGVISEEDTNFLLSSGSVSIFSPGGFEARSLDYGQNPGLNHRFGEPIPMRYENCGGNVLNLCAFQSAFRAYDMKSGTYYRSKRERVYEKVYSVLQQMDRNPSNASYQENIQGDYQTNRLAWDLRNRISSPKR